MKNKGIAFLLAFFLVNLFVSVHAQNQKEAKEDALAPPELAAPIEGAKLNNFPRKTIFEWRHVEGASKYEIEVEYNDGKWNLLKKTITSVNSYTLDFIGKQPGRWRVRAISKASGKPGKSSEWRKFTYLR